MKKFICSSVQMVAGVLMLLIWMASSDVSVILGSGLLLGGVMLGAQWVQNHVHVSID